MTCPFSFYLHPVHNLTTFSYFPQLSHGGESFPEQARKPHKATLVPSEACPAETTNPTPLPSAPITSYSFCLPLIIRLFAIRSNRVVTEIDCFSALTAVWSYNWKVVSVHKDGAENRGILYLFSSCMLHATDLTMWPTNLFTVERDCKSEGITNCKTARK